MISSNILGVNDRKVLGLFEIIHIKGRPLLAKIDTGAHTSSIDESLAKELQLGPILKTKTIKQAHGTSKRPVHLLAIEIGGKKLQKEFNISHRSHMKYKVLIGQNILKEGFLIDPLYESLTKEERSRMLTK